MNDTELNQEVRTSIDSIKAWLASRAEIVDAEATIVRAPDTLRSMGFADLNLIKAGASCQDTVIYSHDPESQKPKKWTEFTHLLTWTEEFLGLLKENKANFVALELIRGNSEIPIGLAKYHVDEAINVVQSVLNFDHGVDIKHPDTRDHFYALNNIMIEDSNAIHDLVRQIFSSLYSKCAVGLVVKTNNFYSASLVAYLVDLMHKSGASSSEVNCFGFERRESIGNERFSKCLSPGKGSKLSTIAVVFKQTDTFSAAQGIIESYFRERYANLIILTEESVYERFIQDWQRYYSHAMFIGPRLDNRTTVVSSVNEKVQIDLAGIDIKAAHKMSGNAINVLKYRTVGELISLLANLRKVPFMSIWNDDVLLSRDFCLKSNLCSDFWLNHIPRSISGRKFGDDMLTQYGEVVAEDMANIYNSVNAEFYDEIEGLRKLQAIFMKKEARLRARLVFQAFANLLSRCKSLKNGSTIEESMIKLKRFYQINSQRMGSLEPGDSRIEVSVKPVGLAILQIRDETDLSKSKAALVEFIFKNLIIGNAVLLACPANTLGQKFVMDNDHIIPFKMVHDSVPDISRLSLETTLEVNESMTMKKVCPKNTYAVEILPEMNSESFDMLTVALGTRRKNIWYPDVDQTNYWSNE